MPEKTVTTTLSPCLKRKLEKECDLLNMTYSKFVRRLIEKYFKEKQNGK